MVLLLDEIDMLRTKKNEVLLPFFDWPSMPGSRLILIAISNTMDLPEKISPKVVATLVSYVLTNSFAQVNSRVSHKIRFDPYRAVQLEEILRVRLHKRYETLFEDGALTFIAASVANVTGDVRRGVQAARKALYVAEEAFHRLHPEKQVYEGGILCDLVTLLALSLAREL